MLCVSLLLTNHFFSLHDTVSRHPIFRRKHHELSWGRGRGLGRRGERGYVYWNEVNYLTRRFKLYPIKSHRQKSPFANDKDVPIFGKKQQMWFFVYAQCTITIIRFLYIFLKAIITDYKRSRRKVIFSQVFLSAGEREGYILFWSCSGGGGEWVR